MKKIYLILPFIFWMVAGTFGQTNQGNLALINVTYVDVEKEKLVKSVTILIEDGLILDIGKKLEVPDGTETFDASGKFILPGMIDSHIHFFQSGGIYTRPDFIDLTDVRPYGDERKWLMDNFEDIAQRYLKLGITSVIDVGGPMTNYDIREKVKGNPVMPNVFVTGPLISTYQPKAFDIEDPPIIKVSTEEEAREIVRKQLPYQPDFIKIWYISTPDLPAESTFPIIEAAVDESHKHSLPVAIHATQLTTAKLAIRAGADFLVHSVDDKLVDEEFIEMLKNNDVVLSPTLMVVQQYYESLSGNNNFSELDFNYANPFVTASLLDINYLEGHKEAIGKRAEALAERSSHDSLMLINLKILSDAGITIATGTDAGNIGTQHASSYYEEMGWMKTAGLSNAQILKASTIDAAKSIGKDSLLGSIKRGKLADLVICNLNPLEDLNFGNSINFVVKSGHLINTDTLIPDTPEMLAQRQLNAYNSRDIDAFLEPYSKDVEIFTFPDELMMKGHNAMREGYTPMFEKTPDLHCQLENRIILGNTVIDHELVTGFGDNVVKAIAIYTIENGKIAKVYFIK